MKKIITALFLIAGLASIQAHSQSTPASETKSPFSIADSASFKGKYKFEGLPFEYVEITVQENKLYFVGGEYNGFLIPLTDKKDAFNVNDQAVFTFGRDSENKIIVLKIDYQGQISEGKKEEKKN
jgi:hypothetical protein